MKGLLVLIFLLVSLRGIAQDIPEFKIEEEYTGTNNKPPIALNIKQVREQIVYPDSAKINRIEGSVKARLFIDENGDVKKIDEIKGDAVFYEVVKNACLKLKFSPAHHDNKPIRCYVLVPFKFSLSGKTDSVRTDSARTDSSNNRETFHKKGFSILDVNSGLTTWTLFIFLSPFIAIVLVVLYMRKRKKK